MRKVNPVRSSAERRAPAHDGQLLDSVGRRMRWAREQAELSQEQLARECGWTNQGRMSHYETGRNQPGPSDLKAISDVLRRHGVRVTASWLQYGDERTEKPPATKAGEVARDYNVSPGPDLHGEVPLISWVQAGEFAEVSDPFPPGEAEEWYPSPKRAVGRIVALRVEGDSMTAPYGKSYPHGSVIFVDLGQRSPASGQRVVAKLEGENKATFKVYVEEAGRRWLRPLNAQYPAIHDPFRIVGIVVGKWEEE